MSENEPSKLACIHGVTELHCDKCKIGYYKSELQEQSRLLGMSGEREAKLLAEIESLKIGREHDKMFFQVAADNLGFDPSCESGKIDPMCTAEAIRGMRAEIELLKNRKTIFSPIDTELTIKEKDALLREREKVIEELVKALNAQIQMRDSKTPKKLDEELAWRENDELADKMSKEALESARKVRK